MPPNHSIGTISALLISSQCPSSPTSQIAALKRGESVDKPIYNHVTGLLDAPEKIESPKVSVMGMLAGSRRPGSKALLVARTC